MAVRAALRISEPLYSWDPGAIQTQAESVSFDEFHQRVIHKHKKDRGESGFSTVDLVDQGGTPDGLFVKFDQDGLRQVRFSPDGLFFAFLCDRRRMGCMETVQPCRDPIPLTFKWSRADVEVLNFFWLLPLHEQKDHSDLVVVTNQGIEVFRLSFEQRTAKSLKAVSSAIDLCWIEPMSGMVLACTGARTLRPFDLRAKQPKMPQFDLVLGRGQKIEAHDVAIMTIYDSTFCIHADSVNGRVSLRNISNPLQGTPEHDIVIDVVDDDALLGALRLSKVDNFLIVHCVEQKKSMIYDIHHREHSEVPSICGPVPVDHSSTAGEQNLSCVEWDYLGGSTIMDHARGCVYRLQISMGAVLQEFLERSDHDLATVIRLLLRRSQCREHLVHTLARALRLKASCNEWAQGFAVLNSAYRHTIEAVSQQAAASAPANGGGQGRQAATVSLQALEAVIVQQSILSEKDMVEQVFYPHFLEATGGAGECTLAGAASADSSTFTEDLWRISLPPAKKATDDNTVSGRPVRAPYLLPVVISYLRSLLGIQILPHKILQCFVFDICMYFEQEHTLQQLLHYHVLLDSPELVRRLQEVAVSRGMPWATQACLDMALRIHEFSVVAVMLLHARQYLDVVPFLTNQREAAFQLRLLLEKIHADKEAQAEDPDLLEHVISEIRVWRQEASADVDQIAIPDVRGCEPWMPELLTQDCAAAAG